MNTDKIKSDIVPKKSFIKQKKRNNNDDDDAPNYTPFQELLINDIVGMSCFLIVNYTFQIVIYYDNATTIKEFDYASLFYQSLLISFTQILADYSGLSLKKSIIERVLFKFILLYTINLIFQQILYKNNICIVNNNCSKLNEGKTYIKITLYTLLSTALIITLTESNYFPCFNPFAADMWVKPARRYGNSNYRMSLFDRQKARLKQNGKRFLDICPRQCSRFNFNK